MITYERFKDLQERLNMLEAVHGVLKQSVEDMIEKLGGVLTEGNSMHSEHYDEWVKGCRTGMSVALDTLIGIIQGVYVDPDTPALPMHPPRPIRIRYFSGVTDTERHVRDGSVIDPDDYPEIGEDEEV